MIESIEELIIKLKSITKIENNNIFIRLFDFKKRVKLTKSRGVVQCDMPFLVLLHCTKSKFCAKRHRGKIYGLPF